MRTMQSRLPLPDPNGLNDAQRAVYRSVLATRGNLDGPFLAWMHSPELASRAEKLGAFCRYETVLSTLETELLILLVAAHFSCIGEQQIHEPIAAKAGLTNEQILALRTGQAVAFSHVRLTLIQAIASDVLKRNRLREALYEEGCRELGQQGLVELVSVMGYYALVAMTLNAFEMKMA